MNSHFKDHKEHSPYGLLQFFVVFGKVVRAYLLQIALGIIRLTWRIFLKHELQFFRSLRFTKIFQMLPFFALEKSIESFILEMDGEQLEQIFTLHVHLHYIGSVKSIRISREQVKDNYDQHKNNHSIRIWRISFYIDKTIFNAKLDVLDLN